MKIIEKIRAAEAQDAPFFSFEFFPPKTRVATLALYDRIGRLARLGPQFVDVTWGAGGSTSEGTMEICATALETYGLDVCMHLTCTNSPRALVERALAWAREKGIQNILALRGDPPRGQSEWTQCEDGFAHAADLVRFIRAQHGDYFCISVAGYPEGHMESTDKAQDVAHLAAKVAAGADYVVTQLFYDADAYVSWLGKCRAAGISCPIVPGIMPIRAYAQFQRIMRLCGAQIPADLQKSLEAVQDDDAKVAQLGIDIVVALCRRLVAAGVRGFHFYTLNQDDCVVAALQQLSWEQSVGFQLPWARSPKRTGEGVRPVFWLKRPRSYVERTMAWSQFPELNWDADHVFGPVDKGRVMSVTPEEAVALWGRGESEAAVRETFARYACGEAPLLPWADSPFGHENTISVAAAANAAAKGVLVVQALEPINGASSADAHVGPEPGYLYQKGYLECFVAPRTFQALSAAVARQTSNRVTFYASSRAPESLETSSSLSNGATTLSWGVFAGTEVRQPVVIDQVSFEAWRDEAFLLWDAWTDAVSESPSVLSEIADSWVLVSLVDHGYGEPDAQGFLFDLVCSAALASDCDAQGSFGECGAVSVGLPEVGLCRQLERSPSSGVVDR